MSERDLATIHRPEILEPARPDHAERLAFLRGDPRCSVLDTTVAQVEDLVAATEPSTPPVRRREIALRRHGELDGELVWIHYPWSATLVRLLPEELFWQVRTSRNRYKITRDEQRRLSSAAIGIVGLSVGHSAALTLALEGVGGHFRLADFDEISLSNMNRLPCRLIDLGVNKAVLAARRLTEINPYLEIEVFPEGLSEGDEAAFFGADRRLDLLVEECDGLEMKVRLRERARALGVPVLMDTNDRGLLDVELFDREPERPIFHGLVPGIDSAALRGLTTREKVPFILDILQADRLSPDAAASLLEIDETISGLPQLATGTALGGAIVTDAARRILLGTLTRSGRFYVDLDALVGEGREVDVTPRAASAPATPPPKPPHAPAVRRDPSLDRGEVEYLVSRGILAPSGGNAQPWRFRYQGGAEIVCGLEPARADTFLDVHRGAAAVAVAAAAENIGLAAAELGLVAEIELCDDPSALARIHVARRATKPSALASQIVERVTNRKNGPRVALGAGERRALEESVLPLGCELCIVEGDAELDEMGAVLGGLDRVRLFHRRLYDEMMSELAWDDGTARDLGIDVATLELDAAGMAGLRLLRRREVVEAARDRGIGRGLEKLARDGVAGSSAIVVLSAPGVGLRDHAVGGRALERLWLTATALGLGVQPVTAGLYMFARLERGDGDGFDEGERAELAGLRRRFASLVPTDRGRAEVALLRIVRAPRPGLRSRRLSTREVLALDD